MLFKLSLLLQAALIFESLHGCLPVPLYVVAAPMLITAAFGGVFLIKILRI